ncbi:FkbM family methyltransferase [Nostoc ellipsosporum NOK]|nr:FkbM family methyltransferase [Nostoc ellipsosporum NOK]
MKKQDVEMRFKYNMFHNLVTDEDYFLKAGIKKGDTVIDAGAFWGSFTVQAAKFAGPEGHVIAFEPDPASAAKLRENIAANGLNNVTVIEKGLWSEETTLYFQPGKELASRFVSEQDKKPDTISIPVTSIDAVMQNMEVKGNLFIKMNIEGGEMEALKGASQTIARYKPYCAIRTDHFVDGEQTFGRVEKQLRDYGYQVETLPMHEITTFGITPGV